MTRAREMLDTYPGTAAMDTDALIECIDACFECAQTCTACADACLGEEMVEHMKRCIALDTDCAAMCELAVGAMSRLSEKAGDVCRLCAEFCELCAAECRNHRAEHCQACARACQHCAERCREMIA